MPSRKKKVDPDVPEEKVETVVDPKPEAEGPPAEDLPAEDSPSEDLPTGDQSVEDLPVEDPPVEDPPVEDPPVGDPPVNDLPVENPPTEAQADLPRVPEDGTPVEEVAPEGSGTDADGAPPVDGDDSGSIQGDEGLPPPEDVPPLDTVPEGYMALAFDTEDDEDGSGGDDTEAELPLEEGTVPDTLTPPVGDGPPEEVITDPEAVHEAVEGIQGDGAAVPQEAQPRPEKAKKSTKPPVGSMPPSRADFFAADYRELDRYLSPRQRQEWEAIYASFRSKNLLYGEVIGSDPKTFNMKENGEWVRRKMWCPVLLDYRVKVLIPETEMWIPGEERPSFVLQEMKGAKVSYVIINVDREGECAIASRRIALAAQRHYFATVRGGHQEGEMLKCNVLSVGPKLCLVECGGYDITLTQRDLSYTSIPDLREKYHPGDELDCILIEYAPKEERLVISVKEVEPNPFIGADQRHPVGARRNATISGKYKGGVFCTLTDGTVVLCLYSPLHSDASFQLGDGAIIVISKFDYEHQLVYGRILSKW